LSVKKDKLIEDTKVVLPHDVKGRGISKGGHCSTKLEN